MTFYLQVRNVITLGASVFPRQRVCAFSRVASLKSPSHLSTPMCRSSASVFGTEMLYEYLNHRANNRQYIFFLIILSQIIIFSRGDFRRSFFFYHKQLETKVSPLFSSQATCKSIIIAWKIASHMRTHTTHTHTHTH